LQEHPWQEVRVMANFDETGSKPELEQKFDRLVRDFGKKAMIEKAIALQRRGDGKTIDDEAALAAMGRLLAVDEKNRWAAAQKISRTITGHSFESTAKRLDRKFKEDELNLRYEGIVGVILELAAVGPMGAWEQMFDEFKRRTDIARDAFDRVNLDIAWRAAERARKMDGPDESDRYHAAKMRDAIIDVRDRRGSTQLDDLRIVAEMLWRLLSILRQFLST
jgi:hypothetical protein